MALIVEPSAEGFKGRPSVEPRRFHFVRRSIAATNGVPQPQGSVLGLLLFVLYAVCSRSRKLSRLSVPTMHTQYADDTFYIALSDDKTLSTLYVCFYAV